MEFGLGTAKPAASGTTTPPLDNGMGGAIVMDGRGMIAPVPPPPPPPVPGLPAPPPIMGESWMLCQDRGEYEPEWRRSEMRGSYLLTLTLTLTLTLIGKCEAATSS